MPDESREERVRRIARAVLDDLNIAMGSVEAIGRERFVLTIFGAHHVKIPFDLHASDDVMRRELRKSVRAAIGH